MASDDDVHALLEAPYGENDNRKSSKEKEKERPRRSEDSRRKRSRSPRRSEGTKERKRSRSKERKERRKRSRSRERPRSPPPPRRREEKAAFPRFPSPDRTKLTPEERDARTVFCMQLSQRCRRRDLEEFFSSVGKVREVKLITDNKTGRPKGIAYIEFKDVDSVHLALGLSGQRLLGVPIMIQPSQAEKNRAAGVSASNFTKATMQPLKLYIGNLHVNINEDMLRSIFEPFGRIESMQLVFDEMNRSKGYGFVTYTNAEEANKALQQLNGFELAGRAVKVSYVNERPELTGNGPHEGQMDEMDRAGVNLGTTGRLQLMQRLAEGTGMSLPKSAQQVLQNPPKPVEDGFSGMPIATQCIMLSNVFDPTSETHRGWEEDVRDDIIDEINKYGGVLHIYVDSASPEGNIYVKCPSISCAHTTVTSLHGRWFGGRIIHAAYVPLPNYHQLFADSIRASVPLTPLNRPAVNQPPQINPLYQK